MAATYDNQPSPASSGKVYDFLDFFGRMRLDIEFWKGMVGFGPCVMLVIRRSTEGSLPVDLRNFPLNVWVHRRCFLLA